MILYWCVHVCVYGQYTCYIACMCVFSRECSKGAHCTGERSWSGHGALAAKQGRTDLKQHAEVLRSTLCCRNEEVGNNIKSNLCMV